MRPSRLRLHPEVAVIPNTRTATSQRTSTPPDPLQAFISLMMGLSTQGRHRQLHQRRQGLPTRSRHRKQDQGHHRRQAREHKQRAPALIGSRILRNHVLVDPSSQQSARRHLEFFRQVPHTSVTTVKILLLIACISRRTRLGSSILLGFARYYLMSCLPRCGLSCASTTIAVPVTCLTCVGLGTGRASTHCIAPLKSFKITS